MAPALTMVQAVLLLKCMYTTVWTVVPLHSPWYKLLLLKCMYTTVWTVVYYLSVVEL